jgi:putative ABC transport system ATP-binding protein
MRTLATLREASVVYGRGRAELHALRAVDLDIEHDESAALWGPSGCGKTTVLHLLGGLVEPTSGSVLWHGEPLASLDAAARAHVRRRGIAYVFQGANLLPYFTAVENVEFALQGDRSGYSSEELLGLVGLAGKLDALPAELSGGEAQRVAIARALGQRPELLLCDEPTGQLDSDTGSRVLDLIDALRGEIGFALVVATHDADVAGRYRRTVELADGAIRSQQVAA